MDCVFCTDVEIKSRLIAENDLAWAVPTNMPITAGHTLVMPKRHATTLEDLTKEELLAIMSLASTIKSALSKTFGAEGFNSAWNEQRVAGQSIPHFHLHIVPRKEGDAGIYQYEPRSFLYQTSSDRPVSTVEALREVATRIREAV